MTNEKVIHETPRPVNGLYDEPMWKSVGEGALKLQRCNECDGWQYPPAPVCAHCVSDKLQWAVVAGTGVIISWVIFHKTYLPAYPAPYNVVAVRLSEGPVIVSNLEHPIPEGSWIGLSVHLVYASMPDGFILPRFRLVNQSG